MSRLVNAALAAFALSFTAAEAATVGGFTFADDAIADELTASTGTFSVSGGTLAQVLTDASPDTWAGGNGPGLSLTLAFVDNVVVNDAGADIVLFELGVPGTFDVTINGVTLSFLSAATGGVAAGFALNAALIDLSAFGLATLSSLFIGMTSTAGNNPPPALSLVAALNSRPVGEVPLPAALPLFLAGIGGLAAARRRKARTA